MNLYKPTLSRCANRNQTAKTNPVIGEPDTWYDRKLLKEKLLEICSFDFFIDWGSEKVSDIAWIKAVTDTSLDSPLCIEKADIIEYHRANGQCYEAILNYLKKNGLNAYYVILHSETVDEKVAALVVDLKNAELRTYKYSLPSIKDSIKKLSGGPIKIGAKGLYYGTSPLECLLSKTDALWPGDVDTIVFDQNGDTKAIYEYKKHNLTTDIRLQDFRNYYPVPDARKYKRLALLRDRLPGNFPMFVIYYPTSTEFEYIKIEEIGGDPDNLLKISEDMIPIPDDPINMGRAILEQTIL